MGQNGLAEGQQHAEAGFGHALSAALAAIEAGKAPDLTGLPGDIAEPLEHLARALSARDKVDLSTVVDFSVQASESMAAVARITGDIREIDGNAQTMASAIEELNASIQQISETATASSSEAQEARNLMAEGTRKVHETTKAAAETAQSMQATETEANRVVEAVDKISGFIGTIDGIASQTNLLALNATIEAARAGEAGKGFAVVASEVKTLSGQTQRATEDISALIESLQDVVGNLFTSVENARGSVTAAQELTAETEQDITSANEIVARTAQRMDEIAHVLGEQSEATRELASGVSKIAEGSKVAAGRADAVIDAVRRSEELIEERFATLDGRDIDDYVLYRAKSDHFLWKKRLSEMLVGLNNLTEDELADHHSCRLGKWYGDVADAAVKGHPAFTALDTPHASVHSHGRKAAGLFAAGDREGAQAEVALMEEASHEVVRLLDELIRR
jgi:methyl-accepting chemotaxis protein